MTDTLTPAERSERMSRVRHRDTKPEMRVRRLVHRLGFRYRLGRRDLPGNPDLVFPKYKAVIFVHGCFWHRHPDPTCRLARMPKSRIEFWEHKLNTNHARDLRVMTELERLGWRVLVIWECQSKDEEVMAQTITAFLNDDGADGASD
jgi:DNA mismatch endonuclease (patch repair protein)